MTVDKPRDPDGGNYTIINHVAVESGNVYLTGMSTGFYTKVRSVDMGDGADRIILCTKGNGGKLEVHAGSETGALLAAINVPASSKWEENSFDVENAAGVDDLYFFRRLRTRVSRRRFRESSRLKIMTKADTTRPSTMPTAKTRARPTAKTKSMSLALAAPTKAIPRIARGMPSATRRRMNGSNTRSMSLPMLSTISRRIWRLRLKRLASSCLSMVNPLRNRLLA